MQRVAILGSPGAGKTTFTLKLAQITGLPIVHLDKHFHARDYDSQGRQWFNKVDELLSGDKWIADGNYSSTFELRFKRADTIIFLDYPRRTSVRGVLKRRIKHQRKHRPEMPSDWEERIDKDFAKFVWTFNKKYRPRIIQPLEHYSEKLITFKNPRQAERYLNNLKNKSIINL